MAAAHHIGLTVASHDDSLEFYRDHLGFEVVDELSLDGGTFATAIDVPDAAAKFIILDAGDLRIELIEYEDPGQPAAAHDLNEPGTEHLGFTVSDIDAFIEELPSDVPRLSDPQRTPTGNYIVFLRDPDGNLVELLER